MGLVCTVVLLAFTMATTPVSASEPPADVEKAIHDALPPSAELVHKVLQVDLGGLGKAEVALYRKSHESTVFKGIVLLKATDADGYRVSRLPDIPDADGVIDTEVGAVLAAPADGARCLVVLYRFLRLGSGEEPGHSGYVFVWKEDSWQIDKKRSRALHGVTEAAAARRKLESLR